MTKYIADETDAITAISSGGTSSINELAGGGWIVTWEETGDVTPGLHVQRYDVDGNAVGGALNLGQMSSPMVTTLADGGWLINGVSGFPSATTIWRFDATGTRIEPDRQFDAGLEVAGGLPNGGWVGMSWREAGGGLEYTQQVYDTNGQPIGSGVILPDYSSQYADLIVLEDGGWVRTWGLSPTWYQQQFGSDGMPTGPATMLSSRPTVKALEGGGWITLYTEFASHEVSYVQRYNESGEKIGDAIIVKDASEYNRTVTGIETLGDGGWAVAYSEYSGAAYDTGVVQIFGADGTLVGRSYPVAVGNSYVNAIEALDNGAFVVTWISYSYSGDIRYLNQRIFRPDEDSEPPVAIHDKATMQEGQKVRIDVLQNDVVADPGDILTIESATVLKGNGSVTVGEDDRLIVRDASHELNHTLTGKLVIGYTMTDGFQTVTGQLTVKVKGITNEGDEVYGTEEADRYTGTKVGEVYYGLGGNDVIRGGNGEDRLFGGKGNDRIYGDNEAYRDSLIGGKGNDTLVGGYGQDTYVISKGDGRDRIEPGFDSDNVDLTDFRFKSYDQLSKLMKHKGDDLIIDLPGNGWLYIEDANGIGFTL